MQKFGLVCLRCGKQEPFAVKGRCTCGGTMLVEYDMDLVAKTLSKAALSKRPSTMWKYKELLPIISTNSIVSLGEGGTPLIRMPSLEKELHISQIWLKREEQNPTGSFKSRGFSAALSILREQGIGFPAVPSNGNAAAALAAYAARAQMKALIIVPSDCPGMIVRECLRYGAQTYKVDGFIHHAAAIIEEGKQEQGWIHVGTLREPGRVEGKKTMGLELAEQLNWKLPDVIVYPTGGGSGLIGIRKAFHELLKLGWISGSLPRFISVQEQGCQPIVDALHATERKSDSDPQVSSSPTGLRVPNPPDLALIVSILKETGGTAIAVNKEEIAAAQMDLGACGISASPEGAATLAGLRHLREMSLVSDGESVVIINTAHADKYSEPSEIDPIPVIRSYSELKSILAAEV
jgi:threonine synthase